MTAFVPGATYTKARLDMCYEAIRERDTFQKDFKESSEDLTTKYFRLFKKVLGGTEVLEEGLIVAIEDITFKEGLNSEEASLLQQGVFNGTGKFLCLSIF